jgi:hypothetical protein
VHSSIGYTFKDKITGFVGVAVARVEYISGCNQLLLSPKSIDNKANDAHWFDEQRCEVESTTARVVLVNGDTPGFDAAAPKI